MLGGNEFPEVEAILIKTLVHVTMHMYFYQYRQLRDIIYYIIIIMLPMVVTYMDLHTDLFIDTVDLFALTLKRCDSGR